MILLMIMMIIDEMICVERRTQKKIMSHDDDDDHEDDDDVLIMMMIVIYFRSLFSHKCDFLQLRPIVLFFSREKIVLLSILKEMKACLDRKMIKPLIFDNSFPPLRHSR